LFIKVTRVSRAFLDLIWVFLKKDYKKHILIYLLFTFIVFVAFALLFITHSLEKRLISYLDDQPSVQIIPQKGGFDTFADSSYVFLLEKIRGVSDVRGRVYGRYFFEQAGVYFDVVGIDFFTKNSEPIAKEIISRVDKGALIDGDFVFIGKRVANEAAVFNYRDSFNFYTPNGEVSNLKIAGILELDPLLSSNLVVTDIDNAREILGLSKDEYSDIVLDIPNDDEIPNIVAKIKTAYPFAKTVLKSDNEAVYSYLFYYKGGIFLIFYIVVLLSFFILLYQKSSALSGMERRENAIFRTLGWSIGEVVGFRVSISLFIALFAFFSAFIAAFIYVFIFSAPLISSIFLSRSEGAIFEPDIDFASMVLVFLFTVVPFLGSALIPTWRASIAEIGEVLK